VEISDEELSPEDAVIIDCVISNWDNLAPFLLRRIVQIDSEYPAFRGIPVCLYKQTVSSEGGMEVALQTLYNGLKSVAIPKFWT
jgi:hypothetical protein